MLQFAVFPLRNFIPKFHQLRTELYSMGHILFVRFTKITGSISNHLSFDKVCLRRERVPTCSSRQFFYFGRKIKFPDSLPKVFHSFWILRNRVAGVGAHFAETCILILQYTHSMDYEASSGCLAAEFDTGNCFNRICLEIQEVVVQNFLPPPAIFRINKHAHLGISIFVPTRR